MSNIQVIKLLEARLNTEWGTRTRILWDDSNAVPKRGTSFIRVTLDGIDSETISVGCSRDYDLMTIQVFTGKGKGSKDNMELCDELVRIFRGYAVDTLQCTKVVNERVGNYNEWYQRNILVDVQTDIQN